MYEEHQIIKAKKDITHKIKAGSIGVIVYKYTEDVYEVEFFDNNNETIDVITVNKDNITKK